MVQLGVNRKLLDVSFRSKNKQKKDIVEMIFGFGLFPIKCVLEDSIYQKLKLKPP